MVFSVVLGYLVDLLFCYVRCVWCFVMSFGCLALFVGDLWYSGGFWWCLGVGLVVVLRCLVCWYSGLLVGLVLCGVGVIQVFAMGLRLRRGLNA